MRKAAAEEGGDFTRYLRLLELSKRDGDWDEYLALAMSRQFQDDLAAWTARTGAIDATGPLRVLDTGLGQAVKLRRIGDAAALVLAAARWNRRLSVRTALGANPAVEPDLAGRAGSADEPDGGVVEVELRTGRDVLRALLRAWERYDAGNRGAARSLLAAIVRGRPPLIRTSDGARWAVPLLRQAVVIDPDAAAYLFGLVDDHVLGDLARELTAAGEYVRARIAGAAMRLFFETKADVLADLALAHAEAALKHGAASRRETTAEVSPGEPIEPGGPAGGSGNGEPGSRCRPAGTAARAGRDDGAAGTPRSRQASQGGGCAYPGRRGYPGGPAVGRGHGRCRAGAGPAAGARGLRPGAGPGWPARRCCAGHRSAAGRVADEYA